MSDTATLDRLVPAIRLAHQSAKPYPNDSAEYRKARTALLVEEIELRRHIERVAAHRRALPMGGEAGAYQFLDEQGKTVGLIDMFGEHGTLVTYFWMYGPERERPCPIGVGIVVEPIVMLAAAHGVGNGSGGFGIVVIDKRDVGLIGNLFLMAGQREHRVDHQSPQVFAEPV